jgi:hypothetical protein
LCRAVQRLLVRTHATALHASLIDLSCFLSVCVAA